MPVDDAKLSSENEKRIVMIGCTGHGKGTLGNFLFNLGQLRNDESRPFEESGRLKPDTRNPYHQELAIENSPNAPDSRKGKRFIFLDTPGLNDVGREQDLTHMMNVFRMIGSQFRSVHTLMLVYRFKTRIDAAIGPALCYYRDLFEPLFRAQHVILVITHVSSDDYEYALNYGIWDSCVKEHLDQCNNLLELDKPKWNCPIVECYFVNSKWVPHRIENLLQKIDRNEQFESTDLCYRSYLMREQILNYISQASEVSLNTHLVRFPPALETERKSVLALIQSRITELLNTVGIEDQRCAEQLTKLDQLRADFATAVFEIKKCEAQIRTWSARQKTPPTYVSGDDWIRFCSTDEHTVQAPCDKDSPCGGCRCEYQYKSHNASAAEGYPKIEGTVWKVSVKPNMFNFTKKEDRYWFYKFWLQYSGESHYAAEIINERRRLANIKNQCYELAQELDHESVKLKNAEAKLREHNANLEKLDKDKTLLLPKQFNISDVQNALQCMEKNMKV